MASKSAWHFTQLKSIILIKVPSQRSFYQRIEKKHLSDRFFKHLTLKLPYQGHKIKLEKYHFRRNFSRSTRFRGQK